MMNSSAPSAGAAKSAAIACGGTGGHLFPGLAVGRELRRRGCAVTLLISSKEIDRQAAQGAGDMEVLALPGMGLTRGKVMGFIKCFWQSYRLTIRHFQSRPPGLVLAMGGFTAAPPVLAGKRFGAQTFLHESNTIPGRANRWLARWVDGAFLYFDSARDGLRARRIETVGMPVRPEFLQPMPPASARAALGLNEDAPVLLVMGGSQGAHRINELITAALPHLLQAGPRLQFIHLTGAADLKKVQAAYDACQRPALVRAFLDEMAPALAAADVAVSRAGASSLAEFAACRLPAVLIPFPTAADNHQYHNAMALVKSGAARMLPEEALDPATLAREILSLLGDADQRGAMKRSLAAWHSPEAAAEMAERMLHWSNQERTRSTSVVPQSSPAGRAVPCPPSKGETILVPLPTPDGGQGTARPTFAQAPKADLGVLNV
jgi:UDP-N-acetylglucosamine--N-acetylmuramyl-(pentapeptide) pyrophosphoryl-undecaprenol N-acetylglucosamine transferase